ncbi:MAG: Bro-N domain-containing protein [Candidatus Omnitrophica bacterium]|nr:Bro-N domain-containing protein [Candidatus Omnitrophota bacterium]
MRTETPIALFKGKKIRKTIHNNEWWFVIEDIVSALTDSADPKQYIQRMKYRDPEIAEGYVQFVHTLEIDTQGGPQELNCANTEGIFRIIQSIPSAKAGGDIAGGARKQLENRLGRSVVSKKNFLKPSGKITKK